MLEINRNSFQNYLSGAARILDLGSTINWRRYHDQYHLEFEEGTDEISDAWENVGELLAKSIEDFENENRDVLISGGKTRRSTKRGRERRTSKTGN
ncbi:hypothetical protein KG086_09135 [Lacticaseibacillus chiayiensis]|uniref:hypothetical protein n=1 Tax=Lacticaseibacillus chiayiensis TaxID=2100821 RepID=UPI001BCE4D75|nr:hypothetical protein [Lacticaseibacillus chiayiensis]QVI33959.1 hypothetical protein KG086_09135 [Lacticaseibacillus chiayiensis]